MLWLLPNVTIIAALFTTAPGSGAAEMSGMVLAIIVTRAGQIRKAIVPSGAIASQSTVAAFPRPR